MSKLYIGIDTGSVSTNVVAVDENAEVLFARYIRTKGQPINSVKAGMEELREDIEGKGFEVGGVGVTGSGRQMIGLMVGADVVKNEITAHATATVHYHPDVRTIFEIGGQDSKIIILKDGIVTDFSMNTVCAAGTGSFGSPGGEARRPDSGVRRPCADGGKRSQDRRKMHGLRGV